MMINNGKYSKVLFLMKGVWLLCPSYIKGDMAFVS